MSSTGGTDFLGGRPQLQDRLRAKLGPSHEAMIGTVRQVDYKFVTQPAQTAVATDPVGIAVVAPPQAEQAGPGSLTTHPFP